MSLITTHVLDTSLGKPAAGVAVQLEVRSGDRWKLLGRDETNPDGRSSNLLPENHMLERADYRLTFETGAYFAASGAATFYPRVQIIFRVEAPRDHYHVPVLLSRFGYTTYRGS